MDLESRRRLARLISKIRSRHRQMKLRDLNFQLQQEKFFKPLIDLQKSKATTTEPCPKKMDNKIKLEPKPVVDLPSTCKIRRNRKDRNTCSVKG